MRRVPPLWGFHRPDGSVGVRNYVAIVATADAVNPVARRIASLVKGTVPIYTAFGRGMKGEDGQRHVRTRAGLAKNPNVAAALVVGLEPKSAQEIANLVAATGKPVEWIAVETIGGSHNATTEGARIALQMVITASRIQREPSAISDLVVGVECGGSDGTSGIASNPATGQVADWLVEAGGTVILSERTEIIGGEEILASNAASATVAEEIRAVVTRTQEHARQHGIELTNLVADNIEGGLSTQEEKALGAILKGGTTPLQEIVGSAEQPSKKGLVFMDAHSPGTENITALAGGGAQIIIFSTGLGNPIACPIAPTIKVSGNPNTVVELSDNIDVDVSAIIKGEKSIAQSAEVLYAEFLQVANGGMTRSEVLGDEEVAISGYCHS
ncbi:MAG: hypothetical protein CL400_00750 [Acidiferrobacteraceae bacterium]|nr:hypothetical protein [Acidiferrobacteraceae bacterium]